MKNLAYCFMFVLSLIAPAVFGQIEGTNAFLFSPTVEIGIHNGGFEGSSVRPTFPDHWRGGPNAIGFYSDPNETGWIDYDGDYYLPGYPENSFGIQIDGTDYLNGYAAGVAITPTLAVHDYAVIGKCKIVEWDGIVGGIEVHMLYKMDTTRSYYIVDVTLTNTNPIAKNNVYFYKTFDPDNNQYIGWGFSTMNQVEHEPDPFCPKSLVHAAQYSAWTSYVGFGAIDANTRVSRGGFAVTSGSDIYNGTGGLIGVEELTETPGDAAISISHKDATIPSGGSSNFQFVVILSSEQVEEAIQSLYHIDYDGGAGALASCTEVLIDVDGDGDLEPVPDTVDFDCSDGSVDLELAGPYIGPGYDITWYNEDTGEEVGSGATVTVPASGVTMYRVVAEPAGDCFELDIERYIIVRGAGIGPNIVIEDIGPQCNDVTIADLVIYDEMGIPGTFMEFYADYPTAIDDPDVLYTDPTFGPGDDVYVMIGDPTGGCYDVMLIEIDFIEISAGLDSLDHLLCNSGVEIPNLNTFLVDTALLLMEGGMWEEITPTGGAFDPMTGIFDPTGMTPGDYEFRFIALGGALCDNDTSLHTLTIYDQPVAGADGSGEMCNEVGFTFDLNTLLSGHDPGGTWSEVTATGGAFNPLTGILTIDPGFVAGDYTFEYTLLATAPCVDDIATFVITVNPLPGVGIAPVASSICIGDEITLTGTGAATYVWDPVTVSDGVSFAPAVGSVTYTVTGTDANGCVNTASKTVVVHALPVIYITPDSLSGCTPFQTGFEIHSDTPISTTDWTFGDGDIAEDMTIPHVSHTYLFGGLYDVSATVTDMFGCVSSIAYNDWVTVETQPIAAFSMSPQSVFTNDTEVEFTNESLYATDYLWDFGDGAGDNTENPIHSFPEDPGDVIYPVTLTVSNYLGCTDIATLYMNVKGIIIFYIPNTFTPDGDQFNETFQPVFESGYDPYDFHMAIYDRWGEIVFESYDVNGGWNGLYGDQGLAQDGVYIWQLDFKERHTDKRHTHTGHVTILK